MSRQPSLRIDGDRLVRDLETLATIGADDQGGVTRIAYSREDREGREWVRAEFAALGLSETTDSAGNDTWVYPGTESGLAPIALGSHTDTVPNGGRYDGALGVLSALAAVRALYQENRRLRHPVEVINFAAEEATMSGATFGSRAMAGTLAPDVVNHRAWDSRTVADHLRDAGLDPDRVTEARRTDGPAAFLELHIEQGRRLETQRKPIGVVEGIAGIRRYEVTVNGYANHAGTTLMQDRQDALVMAAPYILQVKAVAEQHGIVGTVGKMDILPGSPNVIPGQVIINLEIRGLDEGVLDLRGATTGGRGGETTGRIRADLEQAARGFGSPVGAGPGGSLRGQRVCLCADGQRSRPRRHVHGGPCPAGHAVCAQPQWCEPFPPTNTRHPRTVWPEPRFWEPLCCIWTGCWIPAVEFFRRRAVAWPATLT